MSILKNFIKAKNVISIVETELQKLKEQQKKFFINDLSPIEHNNKVAVDFENLAQEIKINSKRIDIIRDSLRIEKDSNEIKKLEDELEQLSKQRLELRGKKDTLTRAKVKQLELSKYEEIVKKIEKVKKSAYVDYRLVEKNSEIYKSIQDSLINALISKKQPI